MEESEQKTLPASEKKLRDARRKGQVPHSRDLIAGATLTVMFVYLLFALPVLRQQLQELVDIVAQSADRPFPETWRRAVDVAIGIMLRSSLPLVAVIAVTNVVSGMAGTFGPVFSFETVKPQFDHVNPARGLKRIASLRNVVEFVKVAVKVVVLLAAFWLVLRGAIQPLLEVPGCGQTCLAETTLATLRPLAATAVVAFVATGLFDILVQRRLFLRDMRMTRTESKREAKDLEGDPLIRSERRRMRSQLATQRVRVGLRQAVIAVTHNDQIVGLRYHNNDTPIPVVVCKGSGLAGSRMIGEARQLGMPVVDDAALVAALSARHAVGDTIVPDLFQPVAQTLIAAGIS
jgi:type III secretion protein U